MRSLTGAVSCQQLGREIDVPAVVLRPRLRLRCDPPTAPASLRQFAPSTPEQSEGRPEPPSSTRTLAPVHPAYPHLRPLRAASLAGTALIRVPVEIALEREPDGVWPLSADRWPDAVTAVATP